MPDSIRENDADVQAFVANRQGQIKRALDVGAGEGTYHRLLSHLIQSMDAVEIWEPNVSQFYLMDRYDHLTLGDIRDFTYPHVYDLVIFGDVLEHMSVPEALAVFKAARENAKYVLVSVPIVHFPQGSIEGNHAETHIIEDALQDLIPLLGTPHREWRYQWTGTFIYRGIQPLAPRPTQDLKIPVSSDGDTVQIVYMRAPQPMDQTEYHRLISILETMKPSIVEGS